MDQYAGRLLADRYRLPRPPSDVFELVESRAFDTASGQEVYVRQVPLPEVVEAEVLDGPAGGHGPAGPRAAAHHATRTPDDPVVRRAVEAAAAAAALPDHARLDQIFDVFVQGDGLWIVSELVPARPLATFLAEERLSPYRAAEVAADLLAALRVVHAHGWAHRNITSRTVLICDDGRALLTGLAAGAAEEVLCGYDPFPVGPGEPTVAGALPAPREPGEGGVPVREGPEGGQEPHLPPSGWHAQGGDHAFPVGGDVPAGPARAAVPGAPTGAGPEAGPRSPWAPDAGGGQDAGVDAYRDDTGPTASLPMLGGQSGYGVHGAQSDHGGQSGYGSHGDHGAQSTHGGAGGYPESYGQDGSGAVPHPTHRPEHHGPEGERDGGVHQRGTPDGPGAAGGPSAAALERASRSGAIAAYRAGTRAGADAISGRARATGEAASDAGASGTAGSESAAGQGPPPAGGVAPPAGGRGEGPTELPGLPRPSRSVPTGWESAPPSASPAHGQRLTTTGAPLPAPAPPQVPTRRHPGHAEAGQVEAGHAEAGPPAQAGGGQIGGGQIGGAQAGAGQGGPPVLGGVPSPARRYRGPDSARAAERARQARMMTVGAVTERWAPEQAGPVYDHWRLAPPVGPAADLWALGALLFRAVQGHPPYPEESTAELAQAVCAEQPAFAEECGALRPVIESLLRQDPTERPSAEELRGWLRSIIRSAPEPDVGRRTVGAPRLVLEAGGDSDPARLPIVRDRGELVTRRGRREGKPRRLGLLLVALVFLLMAGGVAYAMVLMPSDDGRDADEAGVPQDAPDDPEGTADDGALGGNGTDESESAEPDGGVTEPSDPAPDAQPDPAPDGFETARDPAGFRIAVPEGWERADGPDGQTVFGDGSGLELTVVPGRDTTDEFGDAPMDYQLVDQPELGDYRDGDWSSSNNLQDVMVGNVRMAEGSFVWDGGDGREFALNRAMIMDGGYHVVLLRGPEERQQEAEELFDTVAGSYRVTDG